MEELRQRRQNRRQRSVYAYAIYAQGTAWLIFVGKMLHMQMAGQGTLPEAVLVTLLTTTTANVLASFFFVARYLFRPDPAPTEGSPLSSDRRDRNAS